MDVTSTWMTWLMQSLTLVPTTTSGNPLTDSCSITCTLNVRLERIKFFFDLLESQLGCLGLAVHVSKHSLEGEVMSKRSTSSSHHCWLHQHHYHPPPHHDDYLNDGRPDGEALASLELGGEREKASVLHVQVAVHLVKEEDVVTFCLFKTLCCSHGQGGRMLLCFVLSFSLETICCPSGQGGRMVTF